MWSPRWLYLMCLSVSMGANASAATMATLNCRSAHGMIATTICGTPEYIAMDREIAALIDRATTELSPSDRGRLVQGQAHYLHARQGCAWAAHNSAHPGTAVDECLRASMEGRVRALRGLVDRGGF